MVTKDLIVVSVGSKQRSKIKGKEHTYYQFIILKSVDPSDKTKYVLNLSEPVRHDEKGDNIYQSWCQQAKEGAALRCYMQDRNPKNVDQWKGFTLLKKANEAPKKVSEDADLIKTKEDALKAVLEPKIQEATEALTQAQLALDFIYQELNDYGN